MAAQRNCTLNLQNLLSEQIVLVAMSGSAAGDRGTWAEPPAKMLAPGEGAIAVLATSQHNDGSAGWVTYALASDPTQTITFSFKCPDGKSNDVGYVSSNIGWAAPFTARAGNDEQTNACPRTGQPLTVWFTLQPRLQSIQVQDGSYQLIDDDGVTPVPTQLYGAPNAQLPGAPTVLNPGMFTSARSTALLAVTVINDICTLGGFTMSGTVTSSGVQYVYTGDPVPANPSSATLTALLSVDQSTLAGQVFSVNGNLDLTLNDAHGNEIAWCTAPVELYYAVGSPASFWPVGVWVRLLRAMFTATQSGVTGQPDIAWPADVVTAARNVILLCFGGFNGSIPYAYDSESQFTVWTGESFALANLLSGEVVPGSCPFGPPRLNCWDSVYYVGCLLSALGIPSWLNYIDQKMCVDPATPIGLVQNASWYTVGPEVDPASHVASNPCTQWTPTPSWTPNYWKGHWLSSIKVQVNGQPQTCYLDACLGPYLGDWSGYSGMFTQPLTQQPKPDPVESRTLTVRTKPVTDRRNGRAPRLDGE